MSRFENGVRVSLSALIVSAAALISPVHAAPPVIEQYLSTGRLADGAAAMEERLKQNPEDTEARFSLGITQFLQSVESLGRAQYRFGILGNRRQAIPFMRIPVPENPDPEQISYAKARLMIQEYMNGLQKAESTLAAVRVSNIKLPLKIGQIRLDVDGDGRATDEESLWRILETINDMGRAQSSAPAVNEVMVAFDDADVLWLRGYCHVMLALGEIVLAYDWKDQFERTAHLFYPDVETPYDFLQAEGVGPFNGFNTQNLLDVIALIHTINYECTEPERMKTALVHMESVIALSRESWKLINTETDNDHEWLPNPNQTAVLGNLRVTREMQKGWSGFLDEAEAILQGRKLIPFWRGVEGGIMLLNGDFPPNPDVGINLRRMFTEPGRLDLVLWMQGSGMKPWLEQGEKTDPKTWREITNAFNGNFVMFMIWFN